MLALLLGCALAGCASGGSQPEQTPTPTAADPGGLEAVLLDLAAQALARGEVEAAEDRYRRVLVARPESSRALLGVGSVALARGELDAAREHFARSLALHPESENARLGLAEVESRAGDPPAAREHLRAIIQRNAHHSVAHARLLSLTGPAPQLRPGGQVTVDVAQAHPYDTRALLRAANAFAGDAQPEVAIRLLQRILWLGDIHPRTTVAAARRLRMLSAEWRQRKIVEVHIFADEALRAQEGWRFRARDAWRAVSHAMSEIVDVRFVPISISSFDTAGTPNALDAIDAALARRVVPQPPKGIISGFTGRPPSTARGYGWKVGIAQLLGRRLTVRVPPGELPLRTLTHEVLHLFGAIHVAEQIPSLMNVGGDLMVLDSFNDRIVKANRRRTFAAGGPERNVLAHVDMNETIEAYLEAMGANLTLRQLGLEGALRKAQRSRFQAGRELQRAQILDPHLAAMASIVSQMMRVVGRRVEGVLMLEAAAQLYGPNTEKGRRAQAEAEALRRNLERELR